MVALEEAGSGASEAITLDALRLVDAAILRGWAVEAAVACGALKLALAASGAFDGNNAIQVRHEQKHSHPSHRQLASNHTYHAFFADCRHGGIGTLFHGRSER